MTHVTVPRELLERIASDDLDASSVLDFEELRAIPTQPEQASDVPVVAWLMKPDMFEPYVDMHRDSHCTGATHALVRQADHLAAMATLTGTMLNAHNDLIEQLRSGLTEVLAEREALLRELQPMTWGDVKEFWERIEALLSATTPEQGEV